VAGPHHRHGLRAPLPFPLRGLTRALVGLNAGTWIYVLMAGWLMARATPDHVRTRASQKDEGAPQMLGILCLAAVLSLTAILYHSAALSGRCQAT